MTVTDWMIAKSMIRNAEKTPFVISEEMKMVTQFYVGSDFYICELCKGRITQMYWEDHLKRVHPEKN
jgi:hypothetical protein